MPPTTQSRPHQPRALTGAAITAATLVLALVACSGPEPDTTTSEQPGRASEHPGSEETSTEGTGVVVDLDQPSPLEAAWRQIESAGWSGTDEEWGAESRARMLAAAEEMAACMTDEGFEYVPWVMGGGGSDVARIMRPEYATLDPVERARQIGYGFVLDALDYVQNPPVAEADPNLAIRDALGDEARREYMKAAEACQMPDMTADEAAKFEDPVYLELREDTNQVEAAIWQDPRVVTLDRAWSDCMADAGHPGFAYSEIVNHISMRWEEWNSTRGGATAPDPAWFEELLDEKISLAVADETCQADLDYVATHRAVQDELELAFIADREDDIAYLTELFGK